MNFAAILIAIALSASAVDGDATLQKGRQLVNAGDLDGAARVLGLVCEREPANAIAWQLYGFALHGNGRFEEALVAHVKAAGFPQTAGNGAYNAACACARLGRADDAFFWLDKARAAGFTNIENARSDPDFDSVRSDPRFARTFPPVLTGEELFTERPRLLHTLVGEAAGDQFGWVARPLSDLDGDGALDFATTAPTHAAQGKPGAGSVYVHSSRSGKLLFRADGEAGDGLGWSVAAAGDVDGDGVGDVIAGAPGNARGRALVLSGKDGHLLRELVSGNQNDGFGADVCGLGDLDGDGRADVAVGAWPVGPTATGTGRVLAFSGADGSQLFALSGEREGDAFGSTLASAGDAPHRLLVVGANRGGERGVGRAYVYRPSRSGAELAFTIEPDATSANLGQFVAVLGDVDLDGVPDAYASDFNNSASGPGTGRVFVHSGKTGERILTLTGRAGEGFGTSPSVAGDVNGDGRADLIVGAWQNAEGAPSGGKCYLHSGADGALLATYTCKQSGDTLGFDAMGLGDVDGDGGFDFLLTSGWSPALGSRTGRTFVIAGPVFE